jgi:hypothetical protein
LARLLTRGTRWPNRAQRLGRLAIATAVASWVGIAPLPGSTAFAASAHILAYGPGPCGPPGANPPYCWSPSDFHINSGDQVTWALGSGNHGLEQLSTASPWPSSCPKDQKFPTCSFPKTGVYRFQCSVHHEKMSGSLTVDFIPPALQRPPAGPPGATGAAPLPAVSAPGNPPQALQPSASPSADPVAGDATTTTPSSSGGGGNPALLILEVVAVVALAGALVYFVATRKTA